MFEWICWVIHVMRERDKDMRLIIYRRARNSRIVIARIGGWEREIEERRYGRNMGFGVGALLVNRLRRIRSVVQMHAI